MHQHAARGEVFPHHVRPLERCSRCGGSIHEHQEDPERKCVAGQPVCDDCFYDAIGEEIEQHPPAPSAT